MGRARSVKKPGKALDWVFTKRKGWIKLKRKVKKRLQREVK